jgi:hypothetical protein
MALRRLSRGQGIPAAYGGKHAVYEKGSGELSEVFIAFFIKHFVCDFPLQWAYQYKNKGTYGHPGGILHAGIHGAGTAIVCMMFGLPLWLALVDAVVHYHIDWAKMRLNAHWKLKSDNSEYFWWLLGFDQLLHYLTYGALLSWA